MESLPSGARSGESWPPGARLYRACVGVARAGRAARGAGIYLPKRSKRSSVAGTLVAWTRPDSEGQTAMQLEGL
jgi:hypothetical protein